MGDEQKLILIWTILVYFNSAFAHAIAKDNQCCLISNKYSSHSSLYEKVFNKSIIIKNFNNFNELDFNCTGISIKTYVLFLVPNYEILLDNTLSFNSLLYSIEFLERKFIGLYRLKGFNYVHYKKIYKYLIEHSITVSFSRFHFYMNNSLVDEHSCKLSNFNNNDKMQFFGPMKILLMDSDIYYSKLTCPYVFMNTKLTRLTLNQISNSLLLKNQLEFIDVNETSDFDLDNQDLFYLNIAITYEKLSLKILNKYVFKYLKRLIIIGIVYDIETDLFKNFKYLNFFSINFDNMKQLLENNNKWMKHINSHVNVNLSDITDVNKNINKMLIFEIIQKNGNVGSFSAFNKAYTYPDEDFCLFEHFPHEKLVYPFIVSGAILECSCTIYWLIKYSDFYFVDNFYQRFKHDEYIIRYQYEYPDHFFNHTVKRCMISNFNKPFKACKFEEKLKLCNKTSYKYSESIHFNNDIDILFLTKWIQLVVFEFLQPTLCLIGIVTNFLSIFTLKHEIQSRHYIKEHSMYEHIYINSIFNLIYCVITLIGLINVCIFDVSIFCSRVYQSDVSQYFRIIVVYFFGNFTKLCCNISYISFAISRFFLSTNKKTGFLNRFNKINLKLYYFIIFLVSLLLSIFRLFEFKINEIENSTKNFPFGIYDFGECNKKDFLCSLFRAFNVINDFIKGILFFLINFIIDIFLYKNSKKNLENKRKLTNDRKHINLAIKYKNSINQMIFINGFVFFIAYFPEFITNILLIAFDNYIYMFCSLYISCNNISEFVQFFNFISISFQFFVYKKFNKQFNKSFDSLKYKLKFFNLLGNTKKLLKEPVIENTTL